MAEPRPGALDGQFVPTPLPSGGTRATAEIRARQDSNGLLKGQGRGLFRCLWLGSLVGGMLHGAGGVVRLVDSALLLLD